MKKWLFLRGALDANNKYNLKHDLDSWVQLFRGLGDGKVWYKGQKVPKGVTHVFARGGFSYYTPILKKLKNAYKVYYGAGSRYIPKDGIKYDLVLCDSESQAQKVRKKGFRAEVFFKPAANHFKPMDIPKKYDVGFVAAIPEDSRKRCKWVYKTVPKDLKVLQLGYRPKKLKVPKNVKIKKLKSDKMPKMINQCRVVICPYTEDDSGPRIIPEALACGVPVVSLDSVNHYWYENCFEFTRNKEKFWKMVGVTIYNMKSYHASLVAKDFQENFSMKKAVTYLRRLIDG